MTNIEYFKSKKALSDAYDMYCLMIRENRDGACAGAAIPPILDWAYERASTALRLACDFHHYYYVVLEGTYGVAVGPISVLRNGDAHRVFDSIKVHTAGGGVYIYPACSVEYAQLPKNLTDAFYTALYLDLERGILKEDVVARIQKAIKAYYETKAGDKEWNNLT